MSFNALLSSERRMPVAMALVFLPWIAVVLFTAGAWAALNLLGYAIMVFAAGYGIVSVALPAAARTQAIVLAPAVGILAISALTAFWVRLGLPLDLGSGSLARTDGGRGTVPLEAIAPSGRKAPSPTAGRWSSFPC